MRVHHLNCGTMTPRGARVLGTDRLGCHCLLLETEAGLVLVDTGFGTADVERPRPRLSRLFLALARPAFDPLDTAIEQVRDLGFKPEAVRHILLTHLDFDHAGGIGDFPAAVVHVLAGEADAARRRHGFVARRRYRPAQWRAAAAHLREHPTGEKWFGFDAVRPLGVADLLMVALPGHSAGHCGVAVRDGDQWLLHAGDAYFHHSEMNARAPRAPPGVRIAEWLLQTDGRQRRETLLRLRELAGRSKQDLTVFCAHDLSELQDLQRAAERRQRGVRDGSRPRIATFGPSAPGRDSAA
jgi:glyoxylase-like metal-dependent hydrolase (beta-lactamase superfamily II)